MKWLNPLFVVLYLTLTTTGCFQEKAKPIIPLPTETEDKLSTSSVKISPLVHGAAPLLFKKDQREAIYFSASLEKEALKILTKNPSFDELTLFSVLSYALETSYGVKKTAPFRLDCSRFRFSAESSFSADKSAKIAVFKTCQKPESRIAEIEISRDQSALSVLFLSKEWIPVLGLSATLSGDNVRCDLHIEKKKLARLHCQNWIRTLGVTSTSAEELRLSTFVFDRQNSHQFVLKGGLYKDLVERKKIEIDVPLEGKIRRFEKEIEVIDQYAESLAEAEKPAVENSRPTRMQIMPIESKPEVPSPDSKVEVKVDAVETRENGGVPPSPTRGR